ncbi:MAG: hypothetical protein Q8R18_05630 [bacterium]|nr:hypothetical protein [bacterium]
MWKDPYIIAREKVVKDIKGLLRGNYGARCIEVLPSVITNEKLDLQGLAKNAYREGVQNQLLYIVRIAEELTTEKSGLERIIVYLEDKRDPEDQWLGGEEIRSILREHSRPIESYENLCRSEQTPLMKECGVFGGYPKKSFQEQVESYQDGPFTL